MNGNTKVRIRLTKQLFESLSKQVLAEAKKMDMSGGAYTEAVKAPKAPKASKSPEVSATNKMKTMEGDEIGETKMEENKNPEVDKVVKTLVNKLTKHFGHNDHKATIGALKAALDRLEKKKPEGGEDEGEELEENVVKEYESHYEKINGTCYRINDEGEKQRVADHYCR